MMTVAFVGLERHDFNQQIAARDLISRRHLDARHASGEGGGDRGLHLHGAEHHQGIAGADLVTLGNGDLDHAAGHGRTDGAGIGRVGGDTFDDLDVGRLVSNADHARLPVELEEDFALAFGAQVSHRVESEGIKILQVLVSDGAQAENAEIALRLSTRDIEPLIDSLRRHGYDVRAFYRAEEYAEEMKRRLAAFMRYMNT